jgi:hypothetical protein
MRDYPSVSASVKIGGHSSQIGNSQPGKSSDTVKISPLPRTVDYSLTEKELPQLQLWAALGLWNRKPPPIKSSE